MKENLYIAWVIIGGLSLRLWQIFCVIIALAVIALAIYKVVTGEVIHLEITL